MYIASAVMFCIHRHYHIWSLVTVDLIYICFPQTLTRYNYNYLYHLRTHIQHCLTVQAGLSYQSVTVCAIIPINHMHVVVLIPCTTLLLATGCYTVGLRVLHCWPQGATLLASGCYTVGHRVLHSWPQGATLLATMCHTVGHNVPHCWSQSAALLATGCYAVGHRVLRCWPQGATLLTTGCYTVGHRVLHCWPQDATLLATGCYTVGHRVLHCWPQGATLLGLQCTSGVLFGQCTFGPFQVSIY